MSGRTLVVSAGHLLARGYLAVPSDRRSDSGEPVNALFGVTRSLVRSLGSKTPDRAIAVIGTAPAEAPELRRQQSRLPQVLETHGLPVVETEHEADLVASYVQASIDDGHDVVILGSDKRYAQLVSERVWWHDAYKDARYTPEMVVKRFLVLPDKVDQWLALVGDDDFLPGIKGIGKKGATKVLENHGTVERALEKIEELDTRTRNALEAARDLVGPELTRARLDRTRPLPMSLDRLAFETSPATERNNLYRSLGFYELLSTAETETRAPTICHEEGDVRAALDGFGDEPVAVHVLTDDPSPVRGALVGLAAVTSTGAAFYFPLAGHSNVVDPGALAPWLEDRERPKLGHDTTMTIVAFARLGISVAGIVGDSTCASHLVEPSNLAPHDLPIVARKVVQRALPNDESLRGTGRARKEWSAVTVEEAARYAAQYAAAAQAVWETLEPRVDRELLGEYLALSETVARMALVGIGVDGEELKRVGRDFLAIEAKLEAAIFEYAKRSFNLASTKQLGEVLFKDLGLTILKRTKTGWSTATSALERIQHEHPIVELVIHWRALQRMRITWVTALGASIDDDGRVRSTFHPARSFSGRLVNSNPDLGRVPGRTEEMQRIRRAFVARDGSVLLSLDYGQLGLHVLAHLTRDPALVEPLKNGDDMHTLTAAAVLEIGVDEVTKEKRQIGKVVNFATFAGQGASALSQQLAVSPQEAKLLIERFDRRYEVVRAYQEGQLRLAREQGFIVTIAGRRWPIGGLESLDPQDRSYAERLARRATHEGSVADVSRRGLLHADRALRAAGLSAAPLLQIHDEVLFEVPAEEVESAAELAAEAMANAFVLEVPLRVGRKAGFNWADLSPLDD